MQPPKSPADELASHPYMVRWFDPFLLLDTARQAVASALFGQYADRRLIQAALDVVAENECVSRCDATKAVTRGKDGAVWVDFVADLGDGFDSTYAIAYLLAQPFLEIEDQGKLPRAEVLIMGGDQVYPTATRKEYDRRMKRPYAAAFPDSKVQGAKHPLLFLIPGNHDWYDGLVLFLARFCRGRDTSLGSWRATQHRSYFAVGLPDNWWIWGIDTQLTEDIDAPQANYFVSVARSMPEGAKIILCCGVPSWLKAETSAEDTTGKEEFFRSLDYVALIAKNECKNATICAVLSGDTHHYSRYSAERAGTQFITAGGGGAFLHPTHQLKDTITASWVGTEQCLSLNTEPGIDHKPAATPACYPPREQSRRLLMRNLLFVIKNPEFCLALGGVYWVAGVLLTLWRDDVLKRPPFAEGQEIGYWAWSEQIAWSVIASPMFLAVAALLFVSLWSYADAKSFWQRAALAVPHWLAHLALILALTSALPPLNAALFNLYPGNWLTFWVVLAEYLAAGFLGGFIWGIYLLATCWWNGLHYNDAFSAMRLDSYRHFLRMRIKGDELKIYPIGLDQAPRRSDWLVNSAAQKGDQTQPLYLPRRPLPFRLIEGPIVIRAAKVVPVEQVKAKA